jgi:hypothetical protein
MNSLQRLSLYLLAVTASVSASWAYAQTDLENKLQSQYELTKVTADRTDVVTEGSLLVLKKDGLVMDATTTFVPMANVYRDGRLSSGQAELAKHKNWIKYLPGVSSIPGYGSIPDIETRKFVSGEKLWVTIIHVQDDGVVFELFSNPIFKVRYYADLKFPIVKGSTPDPAVMLRTIGEVFQVQPAEDAGAGTNKENTAASEKPRSRPTLYGPEDSPGSQTPDSEKPMKPIPPPPPPADAVQAAPKLEMGWTKEQVTAVFGPPTKIAPLGGGKEIDYYPDFKLTFVDNKVTKIQDVP